MQPTRHTTSEGAAGALARDPADERTTPRLAFAAAERFGDAAALEDGDVSLSFRAFLREGLRAARAFCAAGLRAGDRVGVWAPNLWEWPVAVLGIHAAGGVLVPLNTRMKGAEAGYVLRKSGARILVTLRGFLGTDYPALLRGEALPDLERSVVLRGEPGAETAWEAFLAEGARVSEDEARARAFAVSPDDLSDVLFTSGTTGKPKGVMTCHGQN